MKNARLLLAGFVSFLLAFNVKAQMPKPQTDSVAAKLALLPIQAGEWVGRGWIKMGPEKHEFEQHEKITTYLDGSVLQIEGTGTQDGKVIHKAMAIVSYDVASGQYKFRSFKDGYILDAECGLNPDGSFYWNMKNPRGLIQYIIRLKDGKWQETGSFSFDNGQNWMPFFEMTLTKK